MSPNASVGPYNEYLDELFLFYGSPSQNLTVLHGLSYPSQTSSDGDLAIPGRESGLVR